VLRPLVNASLASTFIMPAERAAGGRQPSCGLSPFPGDMAGLLHGRSCIGRLSVLCPWLRICQRGPPPAPKPLLRSEGMSSAFCA